MIYKMIENCLESLMYQWQDLAEAFQRLANELPDDDLRIPGVQGLQLACAEEAGRIDAERQGIPDLMPAADAFDEAERVFAESDAIRQYVLDTFTLEPDDDNPDRLGFGPPSPGDSIAVTLCRNQLESSRTYIANCTQEFQEVRSDEGQRFHIAGIRGGFDNIASYPVLTSGMGVTAPALPAAPAAPGEVSLQRVVEGALRHVLGRTPRVHDPRSFIAALNQSFQIVEVEGRTEVKWTQRRYAGLTELGGGVSGAQASLYTRARVTRDNVLPLLDGLSPLLPDPDEELVDASRAIVRAQLIELVNELGVEGGPRLARVDRLFNSLREEDIPVEDDEQPRNPGYLGYLQFVFGLVPERINTLEEEVVYTNFMMLRDYVESLYASWVGFRGEWEGRDLGTRLVLLERALSVVAETVEEVYAAMNSVFVGEAERQVASFRDERGQETRVSELLSWVTTFATEEAPHLIEDGGRRGVGAIIPTANTLSNLVDQFIRAIPYGENIPDGLRHPRVVRPLQELQGYLQQVLQLSQGVWRPQPSAGRRVIRS
jgi:hypothetical protein